MPIELVESLQQQFTCICTSWWINKFTLHTVCQLLKVTSDGCHSESFLIISCLLLIWGGTPLHLLTLLSWTHSARGFRGWGLAPGGSRQLCRHTPLPAHLAAGVLEYIPFSSRPRQWLPEFFWLSHRLHWQTFECGRFRARDPTPFKHHFGLKMPLALAPDEQYSAWVSFRTVWGSLLGFY